MKLPIPTSKLFEFLPHRPPMVWVDELQSVEIGPTGLQASLIVNLQRPRYFHHYPAKVRPSALIEWIAQSYGFAKAYAAHRTGETGGLKRAYLVGITEAEVCSAGLETESAVVVKVVEVRELPPACIVDGEITNIRGDRIYGKARIK